MIKSKQIDYFFQEEGLVMEMKKIHLYQLNLRNFMRIQKLKKKKNNSLNFSELQLINLKIL